MNVDRWRVFAAALGSVILATVARATLDPVLDERYPLATYYVAVAVVAWWWGPGAAVFAGILGYACAVVLFLPARGTPDLLEAFVYAALCGALIAFAGRVHARGRELDALATRLQSAEAARLGSEHRFRDLLHALPDVVYTWDARGTTDYVSPRWRELVGLDDATDEQVASRIPEDDLLRLRALREQALRSGTPFSAEFRLRVASGEERWFLTRVHPRRDAAGAIAGWIGTTVDVDAEKRAREELLRSERRYRTVSEIFDFGMWSADAAGTLTYASPAFLRFLGMDLREWQDHGWNRIQLDADEVRRAHERWHRCVGTGDPWEWTYPIRGANGSVRTIWSRGSPVRASDGGIVAWAGFNLDVTEYHAAAHARDQARERLELVANRMATAVVHLGRDCTILWANDAYARRHERDRDALPGLHLGAVIGAEAFAQIAPYVQRVLAGERVEYEAEVTLPQLGRRGVLSTYTPTFGPDGGVTGWVAAITDITDRRALEEQLREANRRKDEFLATLAHELRNPLAPIRYATRLFRAGTPADMIEDAGRMIERQLAHLARLLDDLLDVSRITRGVLELRRAPLDLRDAIRAAVESAQANADREGLRLECRLPATALPVDGDATRLLQVVGNLLDNAIKYTPRGGHVVIEAAAEDREVVVRVRDDGIGMAEDLVPRVFELFTQGERGARASSGLGIGLALARQLVELHGGSISARSDGPGRGSEFTLRLPCAAGVAASSPAHFDNVHVLGAGTRVLVVDDNVDAANSLSQLLRIAGCACAVAYDGDSALALAEGFRPTVALLDLGLPDLPGVEVARRLRATYGPGLALVAVTGWGQDSDRMVTRQAGFDEHLTKPVDPDALMRAIVRLGREAASG